MELIRDQKLSRRIIVLITESQVNNHHLARAIHRMAFPENQPVLYLVLVEDQENNLPVLRDMATMKAVTSANRLSVEVKLTDTSDWIETLHTFAGPGDVILCQEEQTVFNGSYTAIPISDFLSSHLNFPIRTISGYYHPFQDQEKKRFHEFFALFGFLVILALFTWLQIILDQAFDGSLAKVFIMGTFCIEVGAVWAWYKFAYL